MYYETFKTRVFEIVYGSAENSYATTHGVILDSSRWDDYISVRWLINGEMGGSCWGDKPSPISPEEPVDITPVLAAILEDLAPTITFLQFNKLQDTIIESDKDSYSEYYGNWSEYAVRRFSVQAFYDALIEMGYLND